MLVYEAVRAWVKPLKLLAKTAKPTRGGQPGGRGFGVRSAHPRVLTLRTAFRASSDVFDPRTARKF
jgi:hypothetical protein